MIGFFLSRRKSSIFEPPCMGTCFRRISRVRSGLDRYMYNTSIHNVYTYNNRFENYYCTARQEGHFDRNLVRLRIELYLVFSFFNLT